MFVEKGDVEQMHSVHHDAFRYTSSAACFMFCLNAQRELRWLLAALRDVVV